jgi:hypothetical protein
LLAFLKETAWVGYRLNLLKFVSQNYLCLIYCYYHNYADIDHHLLILPPPPPPRFKTNIV